MGDDLVRKTLKSKNIIDSRKKMNSIDNLNRDLSHYNTRNKDNIKTVRSKHKNSSYVKK